MWERRKGKSDALKLKTNDTEETDQGNRVETLWGETVNSETEIGKSEFLKPSPQEEEAKEEENLDNKNEIEIKQPKPEFNSVEYLDYSPQLNPTLLQQPQALKGEYQNKSLAVINSAIFDLIIY